MVTSTSMKRLMATKMTGTTTKFTRRGLSNGMKQMKSVMKTTATWRLVSGTNRSKSGTMARSTTTERMNGVRSRLSADQTSVGQRIGLGMRTIPGPTTLSHGVSATTMKTKSKQSVKEVRQSVIILV